MNIPVEGVELVFVDDTPVDRNENTNYLSAGKRFFTQSTNWSIAT